jgi:hypothetical protein
MTKSEPTQVSYEQLVWLFKKRFSWGNAQVEQLGTVERIVLRNGHRVRVEIGGIAPDGHPDKLITFPGVVTVVATVENGHQPNYNVSVRNFTVVSLETFEDVLHEVEDLLSFDPLKSHGFSHLTYTVLNTSEGAHVSTSSLIKSALVTRVVVLSPKGIILESDQANGKAYFAIDCHCTTTGIYFTLAYDGEHWLRLDEKDCVLFNVRLTQNVCLTHLSLHDKALLDAAIRYFVKEA